MNLEETLDQLQIRDSEWTPKGLLDNATTKLNLMPEDILFIAADYINYNIRTRNAKYKEKTEILNMENYKPVNYDKVQWTCEKIGLSPMNKSKLDFQIFTYAVTSEKLLREYFYKKYINGYFEKIGASKKLAENMSNPKKWSYQDLAISFASHFCFDRPNGKAFQRDSRFHVVEYLNTLEKQVKKGASAEVIVNDLLENFQKYYGFIAWQGW